jgi:hypothetical protein
VGVEILVADHVRRNVARRDRSVVAAIARGRPAIEGIARRVARRRREALDVAQTGPAETPGTRGVDREGRAFAEHLGAARTHDHGRRVVVGIDLDPVVARLADVEGEVRGVDLHHLVRPEAPHAQVQHALRQLHLRHPVVEVQHREPGAGVHADHRCADLDLGPPVALGPKAVTGGQRAVDRRLDPVPLACRRKAHCTRGVAQPGDA